MDIASHLPQTLNAVESGMRDKQVISSLTSHMVTISTHNLSAVVVKQLPCSCRLAMNLVLAVSMRSEIQVQYRFLQLDRINLMSVQAQSTLAVDIIRKAETDSLHGLNKTP